MLFKVEERFADQCEVRRKDPVIAVVIPAYQTASSIADTLRSVLAQTLAANEIIIVNDGSTDDLHAVVAAAVRGNPRVRIIDQANQGIAAARNRGLAETRSEFIALIDADDIWHPAFLAETSAALEAAPEAPFAYSFSFRLDADNRALPPRSWSRLPRHDLIGLITLNSVGNGSAALFRREAILAAGGFDLAPGRHGLHGAEDWKLVLQLAAAARPALVPRALVGYRLAHEGMSQSDPLRQLRAIHRVIHEAREAYPHVSERHFRNANTMMTGWLIPGLLRNAPPRKVARLFAEAYLRNFTWLASGDLRALHLRKAHEIVRGTLGKLLGGKHSPQPLAQWRDADGSRPFAFLDLGQ